MRNTTLSLCTLVALCVLAFAPLTQRASAHVGAVYGAQCTAAIGCVYIPYPYEPPSSRCVEGMWCWNPLLMGNGFGTVDVFWQED